MFRVCGTNKSGDAYHHEDVSAVGIGHNEKHLVLVYPSADKSVRPTVKELGADWVRVEIVRDA